MFDRDGDGYITASELKQVLRMMGEYVTEREARDMVREADSDGDGRIDFDGSAPASTSALITHVCTCMLRMLELFYFQNSSKKFTCPTIETFSSTNSKLGLCTSALDRFAEKPNVMTKKTEITRVIRDVHFKGKLVAEKFIVEV